MTKLTYKNAGVDMQKADDFIDNIQGLAKKTQGPQVLGGVGGFAALYALEAGRYRDPVLVSGTDGVGTKILIAAALNRLDTVGIDLVAMCVNDILTVGARPLFFLDYFAVGALDIDRGVEILKSIARGCQESGCALVGGETAEMPGLYREKEFDLAGFAVGIVERDEIINGKAIIPGDVIVGIPSSGLHSNGFSLVRRLCLGESQRFDQKELAELNRTRGDLQNRTLGEVLLTPTRLYPRLILDLMTRVAIKGIAHITGGGLPGNLPRILPDPVKAIVSKSSWKRPFIFDWIQNQGALREADLFETFNMGIGLALVLDRDNADQAIRHLREAQEDAFLIGEILARKDGQAAFDLVD